MDRRRVDGDRATAGRLALALLRMSRLAPLRWTATVYINVIRGIPLLVLIIYVYFGLPLFLGIDPANFTNVQGGRALAHACSTARSWPRSSAPA